MGIIISMVYTIYSLLSKQLYSYNSETNIVLSYSQFDLALKKDIYIARDLKFEDHKLILLKEEDTIIYEIIDSKLIRKTPNLSDTLSIPVSDFKLIEYNTSKIYNLKKITINYTLLGEKLDAVYFKDQGVASQINKQIFINGN